MMMTLKVLAALLDYPTEATIAALADMSAVLGEEDRLPPEAAGRLAGFFAHLAEGDLMDRQAAWIDQFDRSRSLSLNLFEHVHGESRDRGQAMVDLKAMYESRGLALGISELPDYLPVFLEFLSLLDDDEACDLLAEARHVVAALAERLAKRDSPYAAVMAAVAALAGEASAEERAVLTPEVDEDIDIAWAEDPVEFGAGSALPPCRAATASTALMEGIGR
ncbi:MAG: nitrate reductase molybdenum cofactor assembly chaperone [Solirubrobacterales bacterium]